MSDETDDKVGHVPAGAGGESATTRDASPAPVSSTSASATALPPDEDETVAATASSPPGHPELRRFAEAFWRAHPNGLGAGQAYAAAAGDLFDGKIYEIPNGTYRLVGDDWLFTFRRGRFVSANKATAQNAFGGAKVIAVANG